MGARIKIIVEMAFADPQANIVGSGYTQMSLSKFSDMHMHEHACIWEYNLIKLKSPHGM